MGGRETLAALVKTDRSSNEVTAFAGFSVITFRRTLGNWGGDKIQERLFHMKCFIRGGMVGWVWGGAGGVLTVSNCGIVFHESWAHDIRRRC